MPEWKQTSAVLDQLGETGDLDQLETSEADPQRKQVWVRLGALKAELTTASLKEIQLADALEKLRFDIGLKTEEFKSLRDYVKKRTPARAHQSKAGEEPHHSREGIPAAQPAAGPMGEVSKATGPRPAAGASKAKGPGEQ